MITSQKAGVGGIAEITIYALGQQAEVRRVILTSSYFGPPDSGIRLQTDYVIIFNHNNMYFKN
jgi:hypothetical protein